jgi:transposase
MTPIVSYKNFIKNAKDKTNARHQLKKVILGQQMNISEASRSLNTSRKTIRKLLSDEDLNYEAKKRPKSCPHKINDILEQAIVAYHKKFGYGAALMKVNFDIKCSVITIHRVLKYYGLTHKRKNRHQRQQQIRSIRSTLKAFEYWQFDTKFLTDIPNLAEGIYKEYIPMFEYTLRDVVTGTTFLGYGMKERSVAGSCAFVGLCLYHMQLHGIDTHYVTIQSDNGPEIIGSYYKLGRFEIQKVVEDQYGARFKTTPVRRPTWNSHVETFHGRVEPELYDRMNSKSTQEFVDDVQEFIERWNTKRKSIRFKKTPQKIASEYGWNIPDTFYKLPSLIYDELDRTILNSPGTYLPLKVNRKF